MRHLFIVNPVAGKKKARFQRTLKEVTCAADTLDEPFEIYITRGTMDASDKVSADAEVYDDLRVYACGGDGTLSECANGAAGHRNAAVTHYPCGTGNDFIRQFGVRNALLFSDLKALTEGIVRPIDLIDCNGRYGINICSVGIDARIGADVHKYSGIPFIGGATGYVISMLVNLIKGVGMPLRVSWADESFERSFSLVCACNGSYYGGGFNPIKTARPDDGVIDYLVIDGVSRLKMAKLVTKYAKGKYGELGDIVKHVRGKYLNVESKTEFVINIDGEIISADKAYFKMVPGGVRFIFPKGMEEFEQEK